MLPKGWVIPGQTDAASAQQEAREEAGVIGIVSETPLGSYYFIRQERDGTTRPSQALVYSLRVTEELSSWEEQDQRNRRWFSPADASQQVHERDLARLLTNIASKRLVLV
jgi:ADP-ribose pyrophosphatase YjhB (NUDIX family)